MDRLDHLRQQHSEEKLQGPNLVRPLMLRTQPNPAWRDVFENPEGAPSIPGHSVVAIAPIETTPASYWWYTATQPAQANLPWGRSAITMPTPDVAAGESGRLVTVWPALCTVVGSPAVGDEVGTQAGSFALHTGRTGYTVVQVVGGEYWVRPTTGSGGGSEGPQGIPGPPGDTGNTGSTGPQGRQGPQDAVGVQGPQGWQGWQGPQGNQGWQGNQDWQGLGSAGAQGWQGTAGAGGSYQHPYLVRAYHSGSVAISSGSYVDVAMGLESVDLHSDWDTTYSKFVSPETGWYQVSMIQEIYAVGTNMGANTTFGWAVDGEVGQGTGGGLWRATPSNANLKRTMATMTDLIHLNSGQYVTLRFYNGSDNDIYLMGSTTPTPALIYVVGLM